MTMVFCPVKDGQIDGGDCFVVCEIADGNAPESVLPERIAWNEDQRQKCLNCKWHADIEYE